MIRRTLRLPVAALVAMLMASACGGVGSSIAMSGGPEMALWGFLIFYVVCMGLTYLFYTRKGGLLHAVERTGNARQASTVPAS